MHKQSLPDSWELQSPDSTRWLAGAVPDCVHTDPRRYELIPNPFYGRNELDLQWIEERDWNYRLTFVPDAGVLSLCRFWLRLYPDS